MAVEEADAQLADLAGRASDRILMTFTTGLSVVDGTETVGELFGLFEDRAVGIHGRLGFEAVGLVVVACGSFRRRDGEDDWRGDQQGEKDAVEQPSPKTRAVLFHSPFSFEQNCQRMVLHCPSAPMAEIAPFPEKGRPEDQSPPSRRPATRLIHPRMWI